MRIRAHKSRTNLTIREDLKLLARERGINLSRFLENALEHELNDEGRRPGRDLNPRRRLDRKFNDHRKLLADFRKICRIDLQQKHNTITQHATNIRKYLNFCKKRRLDLDESSIREFLICLENEGRTIANPLKSIRVFFRHVLKSDAAQGFKIPRPKLVYRKVPTRAELIKFYRALPNVKYRALFLLYATSGRRRSEILNLRAGDIDHDRRMLAPMDGDSRTKRTWFSFYNEEATEVLKKYLRRKDTSGDYVFGPRSHVAKYFGKAAEKSGVKITPQILRDWFCCEMGRLGVPDRYVDAFCGRVPRSVLARHYTDFSPERLREIYERAGLRVLR